MKKAIAYLLAACIVVSCAYYRFVIYGRDENIIPADEMIHNISDFMITGSYNYDDNVELLSE